MNYDLCLHADSNDVATVRLVLKNAANYIKGLPGRKFKLHVVANGPAVTLFTREHQDLYDMAKPLMEQGVEFKLCSNALNDNKLTGEHIWPGCQIVAAGLVEIVELQRNGFAYIKP